MQNQVTIQQETIEYDGVENTTICPSHPGEVLSDIMLDVTKTKTEIAQLLGISRQHFYDVLAQRKGVSPSVAARIGKLFGGGPAIWLRLQANYDAWHAEREVDVSHISPLLVA
jgi:antitoxin HigA-1